MFRYFRVAVPGFRSGDNPDFGFPGYWLYIGEQDVIHIGKARHSSHQDTYLQTPSDQAGIDYSAAGAPGSGRIDHLCLNCDGMAEFIERLTRNGVDFSERKAHNSKLYQLFMRESVNGIKVELNFAWDEAARMGRVPGWTDPHKTRPEPLKSAPRTCSRCNTVANLLFYL